MSKHTDRKSVEQIAQDNPMGILENESPELDELDELVEEEVSLPHSANDLDTDTLEPIHDMTTDEVLAAANAILANAPTGTTPPAADTKAPAKAIAYDIAAILAAIPDTFTPALLDKAFKLNDGGKTVRRHLRKHFAEAMAHEMKAKWGFDKKANIAILEYFAARYPFDATAISTKA